MRKVLIAFISVMMTLNNMFLPVFAEETDEYNNPEETQEISEKTPDTTTQEEDQEEINPNEGEVVPEVTGQEETPAPEETEDPAEQQEKTLVPEADVPEETTVEIICDAIPEGEGSEAMAVSNQVHINSIRLNKNKETISRGDSVSLSATVEPSGTDAVVIWTSSDESVASVTQNGTVTGLKSGTTTITAKTEESGLAAELQYAAEAVNEAATALEQAKSALSAAETEYNRVSSDLNSTMADLEQAQNVLNQKNADLAAKEQALASVKAQWEQAVYDIENSAAVVSARNALTAANNTLASAQQTLSSAKTAETSASGNYQAAVNDRNSKEADYNTKKAAQESAQSAYNTALSAYTQAEKTVSDTGKAKEAAAKKVTEEETKKISAETALQRAENAREAAKTSTEYQTLTQKEETAQAAYDEAQAKYLEGSYGFFKEQGAEEAASIIEFMMSDAVPERSRIYLDEDHYARSAASLENMKWAIDMIKLSNQYRTTDNNFPGRTPFVITNTLMAIAQANVEHAKQDMSAGHFSIGTKYNRTDWWNNAENLATGGTKNPFNAWYTGEKGKYEQLKAANDPLAINKAGHYRNLVDAGLYYTGYAIGQNDIYYWRSVQDFSYTSERFVDFNGEEWYDLNLYNKDMTAFSEDEYSAMFDSYYNRVVGARDTAKTALDAAKKNTADYLAGYDNAVTDAETALETATNAYNAAVEALTNAENACTQANTDFQTKKTAKEQAETALNTATSVMNTAKAALDTAAQRVTETEQAYNTARANTIAAESAKNQAEVKVAEAQNTLDTLVETATANANSVKARVDSAETAAALVRASVTTAEENVNTLSTAVSQLEGSVSAAYAEVTSKQNAVNNAEANLTAKKQALANKEAEFAGNRWVSATCEITVVTPVTGIQISRNSVSMKKGDQVSLTASVIPSDADNTGITWSTSNSSVATVKNGTVTAKGKGSAKITVTSSDGGYKAYCDITVTVPVTKVSLNKTELSLNKGATSSITATVSPSDADQSVVWNSDNTNVATVNNGAITAVGKGIAHITVTSKDGTQSAVCTVTVHVPAASVSLNKTTLSMNKGDSTAITATVLPEDADDRSVTWSSDNTNVARVSAAGVVTAVNNGTAHITATTKDGTKSATCTVTVTTAITGISLNKTSISLDKGTSETLTATVLPSGADQSVTWTSDNTNVATVDNGTVFAVGNGTARITVTTKDGTKSATCTVTVSTPTSGVVLSKTTLNLNPRRYVRLTATVLPEGSDQSVTWSSDNTNVATVSNGRVTGVNPGTAHITATTKDGSNSAVCTVTVTAAITGVTLNKTALSLNKGASETITATVLPAGADQTVVWFSDNTNVATVNNGTVTAVNNGTALITATAKDGSKSASCTVTVKTAITGITLNKTTLSLVKGSSETLTATVLPEGADQSVTWKTDDTNVATVSSDGKVTAVGTGTAYITVTTKDGEKSTFCTVTVRDMDKGLQLSKTALSLRSGVSTLTVTPLPDEATIPSVTWRSTDPSVATVTDNGYTATVTPVKTGETQIIVTSSDGKYSATCDVTVTIPIRYVSMSVTSLQLERGFDYTLKAFVYPAGADQEVIWISDKPSVAKVYDDGTVRAVSKGTANITAISNDSSKYAVCTVTVMVNITSITLNKTDLALVTGQTETLTAKILPMDADDRSVTWQSGNTNVVKVDQNGNITAVGKGITTVSVKAVKGNAPSAICMVTVSDVDTVVTLNKSAITLKNGQTETLTATVTPSNKKLIWSSDNTNVATVDQNGKVTSVGNGTANITAKTEDGKGSATCTVTVSTAVTGVTLSKTSVSLKKGSSEKLTATVLPEGASQTVTWSSSNESVAKVDSNGNITAVGAGSAVITATAAGTGITGQCNVTVTEDPEGVSLNKSSMVLKKGNSETLTATVLPAGSSRKVTWSSSNESVAKVDTNGNVTAVGGGKAVITATLSGTAITAQCSVTVTEDPENTPVEVSIKDIHIVGLRESYPYTGSAIKPDVQVYDGDTRLVAGIDYTISYKNNTKAANKNSSKAPVIVIKGKGLYSDSHEEKFTISAIDINEASAEEITLVQTAKPKKLTVKAKVTWEGKTLKEKTDYTIDYNGWDHMSTGDHPILLKGTGNYTGVKHIIVHVLGASSEETPVTKLKVTSKAVTYRNGLTMDEVIGNVTIKNGQTELIRGTDYNVSDVRNWDKPGTCTFVITGSGKYVGSRTVSVKINGTPLRKLTVTGSTVYDGSRKTLGNSGITVKCGGNVLAENKDFIVTGYSNNVNAGKATAVIEGIGGYSGKATVNFTISPDTGAKSVEVSSAEYSKGGAIPRVTVKSGTTLLRENADYTVKVSKNKAADKEGTVTVSFIGNYKSAQKVTKNFKITKKDIANVSVTAADPVWKAKSPKWKATISVYDTDGKKLAAKTDYVIVRYENALTGEEITNVSQVDQNTQIRAIIEGVKNYTGTSSVTYGFTVAANDLSKAKVTVNPASWDYTGKPIEPSKKQIVVTFGSGKSAKTLTEGVDYKIVGFSNNVNKGTANVIVEGIGDYSGVKVGTFRIVQRSMKRSWNDEVLRIAQELFW